MHQHLWDPIERLSYLAKAASRTVGQEGGIVRIYLDHSNLLHPCSWIEWSSFYQFFRTVQLTRSYSKIDATRPALQVFRLNKCCVYRIHWRIRVKEILSDDSAHLRTTMSLLGLLGPSQLTSSTLQDPFLILIPSTVYRSKIFTLGGLLGPTNFPDASQSVTGEASEGVHKDKYNPKGCDVSRDRRSMMKSWIYPWFATIVRPT